jgi:hypothetical protein
MLVKEELFGGGEATERGKVKRREWQGDECRLCICIYVYMCVCVCVYKNYIMKPTKISKRRGVDRKLR